MLNSSRIKAITLDLDDTLWPIWPTIARAEITLTDWLAPRAPATVALLADAATKRQIRAETEAAFAHAAHDLAVLRREAIRLALTRAGDDPALAEPAFEVFFEARHQVDLFADALPALEALSARYPLVALSNGNADIQRVGLAPYFKAALSARDFGVGKPDPRIFHAAAALAGVSAEDTLHVGDDAHLDGVGGLGAGMQFVWVNRDGHDWAHAPHQPHLTVASLNTLVERLL